MMPRDSGLRVRLHNTLNGHRLAGPRVHQLRRDVHYWTNCQQSRRVTQSQTQRDAIML